jgi:hypothetical protein
MSTAFQNTYVLLYMLSSSTGDSAIYVKIHDTKPTKCTNLFLIHFTLYIPMCLGPQGTIIMESNQSNTIP